MPHERQRRILEPELMDDPDEARVYAEADFAEVNARFVDRLMELVSEGGPALALDLGSGPADITVRTARRQRSWRILAIDGSDAMHRHARQAIRAAGVDSRVHPFRMDATRLALPSACVDVVFSNSLLHHLPDIRPLVAEIRRVGRPGCLVFLRDLMRPCSPAEALRLVHQHAGSEPPLLQQEFHRSLLAAFTPHELQSELHRAGLDCLAVEAISDRHMDVHGRLAIASGV